MKWCVIVLSLVLAATAFGQDYDVVVSGGNTTCFIDPPIVNQALEWVPGLVDSTAVNDIAAAGSGRVLAVLNVPRVQIVEIRPDRTQTPFFTGAEGYRGSELVVDRAGNIYVRAMNGPNAFIVAVSAAGSLTGIQPFVAGASSIDLAADQCTLFAVTATAVVRRDVCTGTPLANFTALPGSGGSLQLAPNGDVLLANFFTVPALAAEVRRYDATGTLVRTYALPGYNPGAVGLANGGATMIVSDECNPRLVEVDLATGDILRDIDLQFVNFFTSVVSRRGFTAALGPLAASDVPSLSVWGALALMLFVLGTALRRIV
ncbi:MAG TPA: hypothetical protein VHK90_16505 [Thermoanaerobaculia bacterium]|nr:hypothetical protein [Thermoanaerobaculia bacterium]